MPRRTLAEWLDWQLRVHPRAIDFTLDRIRAVLARLGVDRPRVPVFTVGGTNGKGSVTALLDATLRAGGSRVGLYTSPHLVRYEERIRIDSREIAPEPLVDAFERVEAARGDVTLTFFEYATAAALVAFADADLDALVLEVGLGGRLDAVNAVDPDVAVVVSIGRDHMEYLGDTLEAIGREKAGIFRAGRPAIYGSREMPASIEDSARAIGARLERLGVDFDVRVEGAAGARDGTATTGADATVPGRTWTWSRGGLEFAALPPPALAGDIQYSNAATAFAALAACGMLPPRASLERALREVALAGRFQVVPGAVEWVFDVAHNEDSARVLAANVDARRPRGRTIYVVGMLRDKELEAVGRALAPMVRADDRWIAVGTAGERGLDAGSLAARLGPMLGRELQVEPDVAAGCAAAAALARPGDRVLAFGSFHTVGPALEWHRLYSAAPR